MRTYKVVVKGKTFRVLLENIDKVKTEKWTSSNQKIATVKQNGEITAKKVGNVKIKCVTTNENGDVFKFEVIVMVKDTKKHSPWEPASDIVYNTTLPVFTMDKIVHRGKTVSTKLFNIKDAVVTYKSSNNEVAIVEENGRIKGLKNGKAVIQIIVKQNEETYIYNMRCMVRDKK